MKELWGFHGNRISARFEYEWHDEQGQWWRSHGNEQWEFDAKGTCVGEDGKESNCMHRHLGLEILYFCFVCFLYKLSDFRKDCVGVLNR